MRLIIFSQPSVFIRGHLHAQLEHGWWHRAITIPPRKLRTFAQTPLGYGLYSLFLIFGCFLIPYLFYDEHPDWRNHARRISDSFDHWNTHSWTGAVDPTHVNVVTLWQRGFDEAASDLSACCIYSAAELNFGAIVFEKPSTTLLNRNGKESLRAADSEEEGEELEKSKSPEPPSPLADDPAETSPGGGAAEIDWPSPQDDRGLDSGLKAVEFEEALAEEADELESKAGAGEQGPAEEPAGNAPRRLPSFFTDDPRSPGEKFYVARGISLLSKGAGEFVKTTARVGPGGGRVGSGAAHGEVRVNHASAGAEVQYLGEGRVHLDDHALALVMVDKAPTAIAVGIVSAKAPGGIAIGVSGISTDGLLDSRSLVLVRPLKSAATAEGHLTFAGEGSSRAVQLSGPFLEPVCLDLKGTGDSTVHTMDVDTLREVGEAMWMRITAAPGALPALLTKCGPEVCHKSNAGLRLFLLAADADAEMLPQTEHTFPLASCYLRLIDANHAVNHAAYHRLFTPELLTSAETCALCLGPSSACPPFLFKTTTLRPRLFCVVF